MAKRKKKRSDSAEEITDAQSQADENIVREDAAETPDSGGVASDPGEALTQEDNTGSGDSAEDVTEEAIPENSRNNIAAEESDETTDGDRIAGEIDEADSESENNAVAENSDESDDAVEAETKNDGGSDTDSDADSSKETEGSKNEDAESSEEEGEGEEAQDVSLPLISIVEAVLFAAREPLKPVQIARAVGKRTRQDAIREAVAELNVQYLETGRAFEIAEVSGRFQLMSRPEYSEHIMRIYPKKELTEKDKTQRLTPAMLDTLAIIAYKQPVMRSEIEHIRGVSCSNALRALIERGSVKEIGRRADLVGKPGVYGTTDSFLIEFGLGSLDELPMRNDFVDPGAPPPVEMTMSDVEPENATEGDKEHASTTEDGDGAVDDSIEETDDDPEGNLADGDADEFADEDDDALDEDGEGSDESDEDSSGESDSDDEDELSDYDDYDGDDEDEESDEETDADSDDEDDDEDDGDIEFDEEPEEDE